MKGNSCGLTHLILTFHGWLDGWMDGSSSDKRPELTARLVDCMRVCAHGPQTAVPRRSRIPRSLGPLGSPPREPMLFDWPERHTRPSLTWDRSACQRDASLESPHSVQPSPSHFSASVPHASRLTPHCLTDPISKERFPLPLSGLQSESHSNTAANCIPQLDSVTPFTLHPICTTSSN